MHLKQRIFPEDEATPLVYSKQLSTRVVPKGLVTHVLLKTIFTCEFVHFKHWGASVPFCMH